MDRKKMTAGGFAPIFALVMSLAALVAGQPVMNGTELGNIAYPRDGVVANVYGYVSTNEYTRLLLDFTKVEQANYVDNPDKHQITFSGEEFVFEIEYVHKDKGKPSEHYQFSDLTMLLRDTNQAGHVYSQICFFDEKFTFALPGNSRYSCHKEQSHQCSMNGKPVATLVLRAFELELDGNPDKAKKLEFSKNPWEESCEHWDK